MKLVLKLIILILFWQVYTLAVPEQFSFKQFDAQGIQIFISGAPSSASFKKMTDSGVNIAIDLREVQERSGFEKENAIKNEIKYFSIPISKSGPLEAKDLEKVNGLVENGKDKVIWLFCSSGNRASAWLISYLVLSKKYKEEDAFSKVRELGFINEATIDRTREFLKSSSRD